MKSFLFACRIALLFTFVLGTMMVGIFILFVHVAGDELAEEFGRLRAYEGVSVAEALEALWDEEGMEGEAVLSRLDKEARKRGLWMGLRSWQDGRPPKPRRHFEFLAAQHIRRIEIRGRPCVFLGPPSFLVSVPMRVADRDVAWLVVGGTSHAAAVHHAFLVGLVQIGLAAFVSVLVLALVLTAPFRRMGRSMDRIAAGELDHRLVVRGRDEVAQMGLRFNAMADRIAAMINGQKELLAGVSHELRSPLTRMKLGMQLLRDQGVDEDILRRLEDLEVEVDTIDGLVEDLLWTSRFDLGGVPLRSESLRWGDLAAAAWQRPPLRGKSLGCL